MRQNGSGIEITTSLLNYYKLIKKRQWKYTTTFCRSCRLSLITWYLLPQHQQMHNSATTGQVWGVDDFNIFRYIAEVLCPSYGFTSMAMDTALCTGGCVPCDGSSYTSKAILTALQSKAEVLCAPSPEPFLYSLQVRSKPAGVSSAGPNCDINLWTAGSCFSCNSTEDFKATVKLFEKWSIKWAANHKGGQSLGSLPVPCSWLCLESLSCQLFWRAQYVIIAACPRQHRI